MGDVVDLDEYRRRKQRLDRMLGLPVAADLSAGDGFASGGIVSGSGYFRKQLDSFDFKISTNAVTWPRPPSA